MNPHLRQMRLQCAATTSAPHISQRSSWLTRTARDSGAMPSTSCGRGSGTGGNATPSRLNSTCVLHQKKSDSHPMSRPVTLPKVPVAAGRLVWSPRPARLRYPCNTSPTAVE